jgi:hypothetical protein
MRNLFTVSVATLLLSLTGFAQNGKGKWLVGSVVEFGTRTGTTTINQSNPVESKSTQVSVYPRVGYFFADRWAVGLVPGLSYTKQTGSAETSTNRAYSIAPFVRYYQPVGEKLGIFGELSGISYTSGSGDRNATNGGMISKSSFQNVNLGAYVRPGVVYFITPKIGLETSFGSVGFGYFTSKNTNEMPGENRETKDNGFAAAVNLSYNFNLGVLVYLGK